MPLNGRPYWICHRSPLKIALSWLSTGRFVDPHDSFVPAMGDGTELMSIIVLPIPSLNIPFNPFFVSRCAVHTRSQVYMLPRRSSVFDSVHMIHHIYLRSVAFRRFVELPSAWQQNNWIWLLFGSARGFCSSVLSIKSYKGKKQGKATADKTSMINCSVIHIHTQISIHLPFCLFVGSTFTFIFLEVYSVPTVYWSLG